jgi:hypothetical protein
LSKYPRFAYWQKPESHYLAKSRQNRPFSYASSKPKNTSGALTKGGRIAMSTQNTTTSPSGLDVNKLLRELEAPFSPDHVQWRVTNTTKDKKRGQVVPYADPRAYTDRLNALFSPQGWTREYKTDTMNNITRVKKGESVMSGKVLVTCTVTILGLGSHSGTGEEWADDDNGMTSADAQAFKRACSCFGLGRYFYDIPAIWVDLEQHREPARTPTLPAWALPENRRKGMRPSGRSGDGKTNPGSQSADASGGSNGNHGQVAARRIRPADGSGSNGQSPTGHSNGPADPVPMTISMRAFCTWKRPLAKPSLAASCATMGVLTSQS